MKKQFLEACQRLGFEIKRREPPTDVNVYEQFYEAASISGRKFYNVGAGEFYHPCWTNIDYTDAFVKGSAQKSSALINYDLFSHSPLPLPSDSAELFYTSHTIEHIDDKSVANLFHESYRILKKGGAIRIVTPDTDKAYAAWRRNDRSYFFWINWEMFNKDYELQCINTPLKQASLAQIFLEDFAAAASQIALVGAEKRISDQELEKLFSELPYEEVLNYCTSLCTVERQRKYPGSHMNWFNENKLTRMLREAGFKTIYKSAYMQSHVPVLRNVNFFDKTLPQVSIYMEAVK